MKETEEGQAGFINVGCECCEETAFGLWKMGRDEIVSMLLVMFEFDPQVKSISGNVGLLLLW